MNKLNKRKKERVGFNLNEEIYVRLTENGFQRWLEYYEPVISLQKRLGKKVTSIDDLKKEADKDGFVSFQAWVFMDIFGGLGWVHNEYYQLTILIDKSSLHDQ